MIHIYIYIYILIARASWLAIETGLFVLGINGIENKIVDKI